MRTLKLLLYFLITLAQGFAQADLYWQFFPPENPLRRGAFLHQLESGILVAGGIIDNADDYHYHAGYILLDPVTLEMDPVDLGRGALEDATITDTGNIIVCGEIETSDTTLVHAMALSPSGDLLWSILLENWPQSVTQISAQVLQFLSNEHVFEVDLAGNLLWTNELESPGVWNGRASYLIDPARVLYTGDNTLTMLGVDHMFQWEQIVSQTYPSGVAIEDVAFGLDSTIYFCGTVHTDTFWVDDWGEIYWQAFEDPFIGSINLDGTNCSFDRQLADFPPHSSGYHTLLLDPYHGILAARTTTVQGQSLNFEIAWINQLSLTHPVEMLRDINGKIVMVDHTGRLASYSSFDETSMGTAKAEIEVGANFRMERAYPNPFNQFVTIRIKDIDTPELEITIFDIQGRVLWNDRPTTKNGQLSYRWNGMNSFGRQAQSGIYLFQVKTTSLLESQKIILIK